jgi:hypothetical protein
MTTFLPPSVNFIFKRFGPGSGAIMETLLSDNTSVKEPLSRNSFSTTGSSRPEEADQQLRLL